MQKPIRMAFILINFPKGSREFLDVVSLISKFEPFLIGSLHVPNPDSDDSVFGLLVKADTDQIGALAGSLGKLSGVSVKSAFLPENHVKNSKNISQ